MRKILYFLCLTSIIYSCTPSSKQDVVLDAVDDTTTEPVNNTEAEDSDSEHIKEVDAKADAEIETENHHLIEKKDLSELEYLMTFIPEGELVLDYEYGDLNKDDLKNDVILIAHDAKAEREEEGEELKRTTYILTRTSDNKLKEEAMNEIVVMCSSCGGVFGDPYNNIVIKNGYFSLEHYGGSNWRWTQIFTFKYNEEKKNWFLHKSGGESYHTGEPDKVEETVKTTKDFGVIAFEDYKGDE